MLVDLGFGVGDGGGVAPFLTSTFQRGVMVYSSSLKLLCHTALPVGCRPTSMKRRSLPFTQYKCASQSPPPSTSTDWCPETANGYNKYTHQKNQKIRPETWGTHWFFGVLSYVHRTGSYPVGFVSFSLATRPSHSSHRQEHNPCSFTGEQLFLIRNR